MFLLILGYCLCMNLIQYTLYGHSWIHHVVVLMIEVVLFVQVVSIQFELAILIAVLHV